MSETPTHASIPQQPVSATAAVPVPPVTSGLTVTPQPVIGVEPQHARTEPVAPVAPTAPSSPETVSKQEAGSEPQNSLTKKFTEAEWSALQEFRV